MQGLLPVSFTRNVLVPAWITVFGLACMNGPTQGVAASLSLFIAGVFVLPALVLVWQRRLHADRSVKMRAA